MQRGSHVFLHCVHTCCFLGWVRAVMATAAHSSHHPHLCVSHICHLPAHPSARSEPAQPPPLCPLQDDMHRVIDRQLMDTHLKEQSRPAAALSRAHGSGRTDEPSTAEGKRLFSFFRKI